jgi:hypothetical protein
MGIGLKDGYFGSAGLVFLVFPILKPNVALVVYQKNLW